MTWGLKMRKSVNQEVGRQHTGKAKKDRQIVGTQGKLEQRGLMLNNRWTDAGEGKFWPGEPLLYLNQEEGDPVGLEGTGKFHVANFGLDLAHVPTVLVGLQQQRENITLAPQSPGCATIALSLPFQALPAPPASPAPATASL